MRRKFYVLIALLLIVISRLLILFLPLSLLRRLLFDEANVGRASARRPVDDRRAEARPALFAIDAAMIASVIDSAARRVPRSTCLVRTLAGRMFFSLAGLESRAHLGASEGDGDGAPAFHAWLEHDGRAVIGAMPAMPRSFFA
jgi:hypothetical protein